MARVIELIPCGREAVTKKNFGREKLDGFELLCRETVKKKTLLKRNIGWL